MKRKEALALSSGNLKDWVFYLSEASAIYAQAGKMGDEMSKGKVKEIAQTAMNKGDDLAQEGKPSEAKEAYSLALVAYSKMESGLGMEAVRDRMRVADEALTNARDEAIKALNEARGASQKEFSYKAERFQMAAKLEAKATKELLGSPEWAGYLLEASAIYAPYDIATATRLRTDVAQKMGEDWLKAQESENAARGEEPQAFAADDSAVTHEQVVEASDRVKNSVISRTETRMSSEIRKIEYKNAKGELVGTRLEGNTTIREEWIDPNSELGGGGAGSIRRGTAEDGADEGKLIITIVRNDNKKIRKAILEHEITEARMIKTKQLVAEGKMKKARGSAKHGWKK